MTFVLNKWRLKPYLLCWAIKHDNNNLNLSCKQLGECYEKLYLKFDDNLFYTYKDVMEFKFISEII